MMRYRQWIGMLAIVALVGCSRPASREQGAPPEPQPGVEAPSGSDIGQPGEQGGQPNVQGGQPDGQGGQPEAGNPAPDPADPVAQDRRLREFLTRYYTARTRGDRQAVEAMTEGAYRERALATLQADTGVPVEVVRLEGTGFLPSEAEFALIVVRKRAGKEGGVHFRMRPRGDSWVIVDLLDPATGRWLSDPPPRTAPMPAALRAEMETFVRKFYTEARSFTGGAEGVNYEKLYAYAGGGYENYLRNLLRKTTVQSERYQVKSIRLLSWMPADTPDQGTAEIEVVRTLTRATPDGKQTTETGTARLRVRYGVQPDDRVGWKVVDGFLPDEHAWVTTMAWSGLLTAA